jgi:hypothetical protein
MAYGCTGTWRLGEVRVDPRGKVAEVKFLMELI